MNIGVDIRVLQTALRTGVGEYTYELLRAIIAQPGVHHFFLLYDTRFPCPEDVREWSSRQVHIVGLVWPRKSWLILFHRPYIDECIPKAVFAHTNTTRLDYFFSPNLHFTAVSPSVKHILMIHDLSFEHFPTCFTWKRRLWHAFVRPRRLSEQATMIVTPSQYTRQDVMATYGISPEKIHAIVPGLSDQFVDPPKCSELVRKKYQLPAKYIFFLGTIEPRKNILGLLEAYRWYRSAYHGTHDPYTLVIAGGLGWQYTAVRTLMQRMTGVQYIGYVAAADKPTLYQAAAVFVYPSIYEGFGLPVLEAMACGTPVITTDRSALPEVVQRAAYLVSPYRIHDMAEGMRQLTTDEACAALYRQRGITRAREFGGWDRAAVDFLALL